MSAESQSLSQRVRQRASEKEATTLEYQELMPLAAMPSITEGEDKIMKKDMQIKIGVLVVVMVLVIASVGIVATMMVVRPSAQGYTMTVEVTQNNFGQEGAEKVGFTVTATQHVTEIGRTYTRTVDRFPTTLIETGVATRTVGVFYDSEDVINVEIEFDGYTNVVQFTYDWSQDVYEVTWQDFTIRFGKL